MRATGSRNDWRLTSPARLHFDGGAAQGEKSRRAKMVRILRWMAAAAMFRMSSRIVSSIAITPARRNTLLLPICTPSPHAVKPHIQNSGRRGSGTPCQVRQNMTVPCTEGHPP